MHCLLSVFKILICLFYQNYNNYSLPINNCNMTKIKQPTQEQYNNILIENQRLQKQLSILTLELQEKDRIITQLKLQIDSTIIEDTKSKLKFIRMIEKEVDERIADVDVHKYRLQERKQFLMNTNLCMGDLESYKVIIEKATKELEGERELVKIYQQKIQHLKNYIYTIVEQKDFVIKELTTIIKSLANDPSKMNILKQKCELHETPQKFIKQTENRWGLNKERSRKKSKPSEQQDDANRDYRGEPLKPNKKGKVYIKRNL